VKIRKWCYAVDEMKHWKVKFCAFSVFINTEYPIDCSFNNSFVNPGIMVLERLVVAQVDFHFCELLSKSD
jgi:hypothetical protein